MTLRARLALGLAIIALVLVVPLFVVQASMKRLHEDVRTLRDREFRASLALGDLRDALGEVRARQVALGVVKSDTVHRQLLDAIRAARTHADSLSRTVADSVTGPIRSRLALMETTADSEYEAWRSGRDAQADSIESSVMAPALAETERLLKPIERSLRVATSTKVDRAESALTDAERLSVAALGIALAVATLIALWLTRSISGPVQALERGLRAVADGELEHRLDLSPERRDEFGRLAESFSIMSTQLAELDKLKAEFVSVASHELKTPINVILGYLQLMQEGIYGPLSEKQAEILATVESQGRTLARLAAHLLDVTRFEAGGGRIEPRSIRLATLLEELERAFHVLAVQRGIDFRVSLADGLPEEVQWDVDRINEVMGNLLSNAFKFTRDGGVVELSAAPSDHHVEIRVHDSGAGIPPDQLPHIFEKFFQADNQGAASASGSGLGLAIAKEIVEAHHGTIRCDSTVGHGTTFTLLLPTEVLSRRSTGQHRIVELQAVS
ncbi:MAG TPA: HAMP domain-containing sensor histidine kinase [Gemmatimonadaceae bacterium]|nr:HAMP domain-containing sensor histidine kinase [Gemmatimonadaceae bacterium]